ncbi:MAG: RsmB/NOP family class I SAM-dependent RNA methyltransferase, partial [Candidatus Hodarchaeota archaeon]
KEELFHNKTDAENLALQYFHPLWFVDYMILMLGRDEALQLMKANNESKQVWLRINKLKEKRPVPEIIQDLARAGVVVDLDVDFPDVLKVIKTRKSPVTTQLYRSKHIFAQDKTSSAIGHILDPHPHEIIVDLACAYGLKFVHIATLMKKTGCIIGLDISSYRIRKMHRSFKRMLGKNTHLICADSRYLPLKKHIADRILLDAPCSSSGIYHMYPDHKWRDRSIVDRFSRLQKELFLSSLDMLKSNGIGLYSVCSLFYEEGEQIVIDNLTQIQPIPINYGSPAYSISPEGEKIDLPFCRRTFPHREHTGGFFISKFTVL